MYWIVLAMMWTTQVWAGWSGNGGGETSDFNNIWFTGAEPIPYCMNLDRDDWLQETNKKWQQFFVLYGLDQEQLGLKSDGMIFPDQRARGISHDWERSHNCPNILKQCIGHEQNPEACAEALASTVLFLFGESNQVIEKYLSTSDHKEGLAIRTEYNHKTYRSGGIVWLSKRFESDPRKQKHLLLHELGHVYGFLHNSMWVMAENIVSLLDTTNEDQLLNIESTQWPYSLAPGYQLPMIGNLAKQGAISHFDILNPFQANQKATWHIDTVKTDVIEFTFTLENGENSLAYKGKLKPIKEEMPNSPSIYTTWLFPFDDLKFGTGYFNSGFVGWSIQGHIQLGPVIAPVFLRFNQTPELLIYWIPSQQYWSFI